MRRVCNIQRAGLPSPLPVTHQRLPGVVVQFADSAELQGSDLDCVSSVVGTEEAEPDRVRVSSGVHGKLGECINTTMTWIRISYVLDTKLLILVYWNILHLSKPT